MLYKHNKWVNNIIKENFERFRFFCAFFSMLGVEKEVCRYVDRIKNGAKLADYKNRENFKVHSKQLSVGEVGGF